MALLNKKLDKMIDLFEKTMAILERRKTPKKEEETSTNWSIENYKNCLLVKFSYNVVFKDYIKELGGRWMVAKKAWMFPKSNKSFIEKVQTKFPDWKLTQIEQSEEQPEEEVDVDF
jgi:hypothetical protein